MNIIIENSEVIIKDKNSILVIEYLENGNGDLYWSTYSKNKISNIDNACITFYITKDNNKIYKLFNKLFTDIENINLPNSILNKDTNTITWSSDETNPKVSNYLEIIKETTDYKLEFHTRENLLSYASDIHSPYYIPIRFRNSRSYHKPYNIPFMDMYYNLLNLNNNKVLIKK